MSEPPDEMFSFIRVAMFMVSPHSNKTLTKRAPSKSWDSRRSIHRQISYNLFTGIHVVWALQLAYYVQIDILMYRTRLRMIQNF